VELWKDLTHLWLLIVRKEGEDALM